MSGNVTVVLFVFQFYPVCNFGRFSILVGLSEVKALILNPRQIFTYDGSGNLAGKEVASLMRPTK